MINADYNVRFRDNFRAGGRHSAGAFNDLARALNGMRGEGGIIVRVDRSGIVISGGATAAKFSGAAEVSGYWYYGLDSEKTKPYVVIPLDGSAPREDEGPMPNPNPANEVWFPKATTAGDIHVGANR